jgi:microcystin-dependent protein
MIVPFAGLIAPAGWLICDGREIQIQVYQELFSIIQYNFKDASQLVNSLATHFALPDFRGRFLLGADTMGGVPAQTTQNVAASFVGGKAGTESKTIKKNNLPAHEHSLVSPGGIQHYAIRDDLPAEEDQSNNVPSLSIPTGAENVSGIPSSGQIRGGGIDANDQYNTVDNELVGRNLDIMPPYATVNYIIFANKE